MRLNELCWQGFPAGLLASFFFFFILLFWDMNYAHKILKYIIKKSEE
jgi:hypothetical protein